MRGQIDLSNYNIKLFVKYVRAECRAHGFRVELRKVSYLWMGKGLKCSGYFDEESKRLVVAAKHPLALEVFAHEFAHFTQWKDKIQIWKDAGFGMHYIERWLEGNSVRNIKKWVALSRDLELDNEKRTVALIKAFNLPINTDAYIKRANAYVLFYNWLLFNRRWSTPENSPYRNPTLLKACSTKFNMRYDKLSMRMIEAFSKSGI